MCAAYLMRALVPFVRRGAAVRLKTTGRFGPVPALPASTGWERRPYCRAVSDDPAVIQSPHRVVTIPDTVGVAEHVMCNLPKYGDKVAFVNGVTGQETTYSQLQTQISRVTSGLVRSGLVKGDVVTIFSPNCPEFAVMYLAVSAMGGIVSAVNPLYTPGELSHVLDHSGARLLVTSSSLLEVSRQAVRHCPNVTGTVVFGGQGGGCRPFTDLLDDDGTLFPENLTLDCKEDLVALPYSSGTTGLPKGIMLSHYNVVSNIEQVRTQQVFAYQPSDCLLGLLPFFHIYGQVVIMLTGLAEGLTITTLPKFEVETFLKTAQEQRVTFVHLVPPIALFLAQHPLVDKFDLSSIRNIFIGAAPVSSSVLEQVVSRMKQPVKLRQGYGLTECTTISHCNPPVDYKYSSIGVPIHNTEVKVVDVTSHQTLGYGHEGEIWLRGPQVMKGYLNNPKATADTVDAEGWLHTGDLGYCQPDSHFYITDRLKELIKYKGFQVAPAELEALLLEHPSVKDSAVIGIPDDRAGELPRAYIVLAPDTHASEQDIQEFVKGKVAPYKKLSGGVEFIQEVPKSASGKILRRVLKDAYREITKSISIDAYEREKVRDRNT